MIKKSSYAQYCREQYHRLKVLIQQVMKDTLEGFFETSRKRRVLALRVKRLEILGTKVVPRNIFVLKLFVWGRFLIKRSDSYVSKNERYLRHIA